MPEVDARGLLLAKNRKANAAMAMQAAFPAPDIVAKGQHFLFDQVDALGR